MRKNVFIAVCCTAALPVALLAGEGVPRAGTWRAWLDSPGGELPFGLKLGHQGVSWRAWLLNGEEQIEVPVVDWDGQELVLDIDYYDSRITATPRDNGSRLDGHWEKRASGDGWTFMAFHAKHGKARRFRRVGPASTPAGPHTLDGRWSVRFLHSDDPAVGIFTRQSDDTVTGTFLTTTGDYRYLAGQLDGDRLRLSCFDGAHAFLFDARIQPDCTLEGNFWSGDRWHETWTARRDPDAALPDSFTLTKWTGNPAAPGRLGDLVFPDLDGRPRSLGDPAFAGKARIIEVFGSWCPNCNDATRYLVELDRKYRTRGLRILGLAFELTGDFERDAVQVRTYAKRHGIQYPILIAGVSDKKKASAALPVLDRVRAYPTTIFLDADGRIRAVHTGFSGPATGDAHRKLRAEFEKLIEELLTESLAAP